MVSSAEKERGIPIWDFRNLGCILFQRKKRLPGFEIFDDCGWEIDGHLEMSHL